MFQPQNESWQYERLFVEIDVGKIKVPKFQRDFVWDKDQTAKLIDSIIKGFPIGAFIFWKTREELRHMKNVGNADLPEIPKGDAALYVLDGQQRITSLYAVRKGARATKDGKEIDYTQIAINLALDPDTDETVVLVEPPQGADYITVYKLLNGDLLDLTEEYKCRDLLRKIDIYRRRLTDYNFPVILIPECRLDVACEVFTRINTGGTELTLFEIMVAKTYDQTRDFDLAREYERLIDSNGSEKDLEDAGFETVPDSIVLQSIAAHLCGQVRSKDILRLDKAQFIEAWPVVKNALFSAVDFIRTHLRIPVSLLLPYYALLVPFTYFFVRNAGRMPSPRQAKLLTQYFWWASLCSRFTSGTEGKLLQDLARVDEILKEQAPNYGGEEVKLSIEDIRWRWFSAGDAFCKAVLCLYAYYEPKSFASNAVVKLDNSWLKQANSKNYHHFFPKGYLSKNGPDGSEANCILNITLVDDFLNKRKIRNRAPSVYMKEFRRGNDELDSTMRTHLITDMDAFGVWQDDYVTFIERRGKKVLAELAKRLEPDLH